MSRLALHLHIRGRVQGVGFRASVRREARALGLSGTVRNLVDGAVAIDAEGPADALERLLAWARRGPPGAVVEHVRVEWGEARGDRGDFEIGL